jgi:hypothetical protein
MYEHTSELPEGPTAGDSVFQPPDKHKRLRTKAELVAEKQKNTKKKVTKRKSPPNSPQQQQEGNKRSKTTTQTAAATAQTNTTAGAGANTAGEQMLGTASGEQGELGTSRRHF